MININKLKSTCLIALGFNTLILGNIYANTIDNSKTVEKVAPAEYSQFTPILSKSKLQISTANGVIGNKREVATDSNFTGIIYDGFYVNKDSQALVFTMSGNKLRSELRIKKNFRTDLPDTFYHLKATLEPVNPMESVKNSDFLQNEITYLQVHNNGFSQDAKGRLPHPLLRIVWKKDKNGILNHYWAIIKNNTLICKGEEGISNKDKPECQGKNEYTSYDLGELKDKGTSDFEIIVGKQTLLINVDGETKVTHDIAYWKDVLSFFKAGVYNQFSKGTSQVNFYKLEYFEEKK